VWLSSYDGRGFVRYFDTVTNNTSAPQTYHVRIGSEFRAMVNGTVSTSPSGPEWVVRRNDVSGNYPTWVEVFGSVLAPAFSSTFTETTRSRFTDYTVTLQPGETKAFLRVLFQRSGVLDQFPVIEAEAALWTSLGARMLEGLSPGERALIVNMP
jgi:hypothetical protein